MIDAGAGLRSPMPVPQRASHAIKTILIEFACPKRLQRRFSSRRWPMRGKPRLLAIVMRVP